MPNKISIRNIQTEWLNSQCLVLISKYAVVLKEQEQNVLDLRDVNVLQHVIEHAMETDSPELKSIYADIKTEIKRCLTEPEVAEKVAAESIPSFILTSAKDLGIPKSELVQRWFKLGL